MACPIPLVSKLGQSDRDLVKTRQHALGHSCSLGCRSDGAWVQVQRVQGLLGQSGHICRRRHRLAELDQHVLCGGLDEILRGAVTSIRG
jgi:hypothetical protein